MTLDFSQHLMVIQGSAISDARLSNLEKIVCLAISTLTLNGSLKACTASNASIAYAIGAHPQRCRAAIYKLIKYGYVESIQDSSGNRFLRTKTAAIPFDEIFEETLEEGVQQKATGGVAKSYRGCSKKLQGGGVAKCDTKQYPTESRSLNLSLKDTRTRETPQHEPDHDPTSVQLDDFQKEDVLLSYNRELGKDRAQWALTRGIELLEAWLVKRDPNTNRYNYESLQKAHHGKILKGWVLRELQKEISSQRGAQKLSGAKGRNGTAQKSTGWGYDEKTNRILDEMFGPIEPVDITNT